MMKYVAVLLVILSLLLSGAPAPAQEDSRADGAAHLTTSSHPTSDQNPAFSPDGTKLIFTRFENGYNEGPSGIYQLDLDSGVSGLLTDAPGSDNVNLPGAAWNAATERIAFSSDREDIDEIWTMSSDGNDLRRITDHHMDARFVEPSFSPDGDWIVFEANEGKQGGSIWKVRTDGKRMIRLTAGPARGTDDRQPNWSPTGSRIVFQRRTVEDEDWNLYTMNPDGGDIRQITTTGGATDPSWSPDGGWIAYSLDHGLPSANIFVIPATGGTPTRITYADEYYDGAPSWSPDGGWIAFESRPSGGNTPTSIWRIPVPTLAAPSDLPACVATGAHSWVGYTPIMYNIDGSFTLTSHYGTYQDDYEFQQAAVTFPEICQIVSAAYENHQDIGVSSTLWLNGSIEDGETIIENPTRPNTTFYLDQPAYALLLRGAPGSPFKVTITLQDAVAVPEKPLLGVDDFLYQLQDLDLEAAGMSAYDLVIMDYSSDARPYTADEIAALKDSPGGPKIVFAYMSIGEAEDYRFYWEETWYESPPSWLDAENPDWEGNYKVRYWEPAWQEIILEYTDRLLEAGFDGVYLDIIDAYEHYESLGRESAAQEMVEFVATIAEHAHEQTPDFYIIPQNAPELAEHDPAYLDIVDGIGQEDIYYGYEDEDIATPPEETVWLESQLDKFLRAGKLVLTIDYATTPSHITDAYTKSRAKGYVPFVTTRALDQLTIHPAHPPD